MAKDVRTVKLDPLEGREERLRRRSELPGYETDAPMGRQLLAEGRSYQDAKREANLEKLRQMTEGAYYGALGAPIPTTDTAAQQQAKLQAQIALQKIKTDLAQMETDIRQQKQVSEMQKYAYASTLVGDLLAYESQVGVIRGNWTQKEADIATKIYEDSRANAKHKRDSGWEAQLANRHPDYYADFAKRLTPIDKSMRLAIRLQKEADGLRDDARKQRLDEAATTLGTIRGDVLEDLDQMDSQKKALYIEYLASETGFDLMGSYNIYKTVEDESGQAILKRDSAGNLIEDSAAKRRVFKSLGAIDMDTQAEIASHLSDAERAKFAMQKLDSDSGADDEKALKTYRATMPKGISMGSRYTNLMDRLLDTMDPDRPGAEERVQVQDSGDPGSVGLVVPPERGASAAKKEAFVSEREGEDAYYDPEFDRVVSGTEDEIEAYRQSGMTPQEFAEAEGQDDMPHTQTWKEYAEAVRGQQAAGPGAMLQETGETVDELYAGLTAPNPTPEDQMVKDKIINSEAFQQRYTQLYGSADFDTDRAFKHFMGQVRFAGRQQTRLARTKERQDVLQNPEDYPKAKVAGAVVTTKAVEGAEKLASGVNKSRLKAQEVLSKTPTDYSAVRLGGRDEWAPPPKAEIKQTHLIRNLIDKRRGRIERDETESGE